MYSLTKTEFFKINSQLLCIMELIFTADSLPNPLAHNPWKHADPYPQREHLRPGIKGYCPMKLPLKIETITLSIQNVSKDSIYFEW